MVTTTGSIHIKSERILELAATAEQAAANGDWQTLAKCMADIVANIGSCHGKLLEAREFAAVGTITAGLAAGQEAFKAHFEAYEKQKESQPSPKGAESDGDK